MKKDFRARWSALKKENPGRELEGNTKTSSGSHLQLAWTRKQPESLSTGGHAFPAVDILIILYRRIPILEIASDTPNFIKH
jgi:hypothetical protein